MAEQPGRVERAVSSVLDNASRLQAPAVEKYVWRLRRAHPEESPQQIVTRLEKMFLNAVTSSGGAAGATAAIPGVGTVASVAAIGGETAFFLEAAALLTLSVASVHGISVTDHERRKALVLAVALGDSGKEIVQRSLGRTGNVGKMLSAGIPGGANLSGLNKRLISSFVRKFAARRGAVMLGTLLPAGIGAAVGGAGNRALGKTVVGNARDAFGPPPPDWPADSPPVVAEPR